MLPIPQPASPAASVYEGKEGSGCCTVYHHGKRNLPEYNVADLVENRSFYTLNDIDQYIWHQVKNDVNDDNALPTNGIIQSRKNGMHTATPAVCIFTVTSMVSEVQNRLAI